MGSCYSRKSGGGNYTYSTVDMTSTKLDESSRLVRPTPYSRNSPVSSSVFSSRKGIPVPTKTEHSPRMSRHKSSDAKNAKISQPAQSSIPKFSSNSPLIKNELNENLINANIIKNETSQLHLVNNNTVSISSTNMDNQETPGKFKQTNKLNYSNKNSPELVQVKIDEKPSTRIPAKVSYMTAIPRPQLLHQTTKSPYSVSASVLHSENLCNVATEGNINKNSNDFNGSKISCTESQGSIADFDSGLGNSFVDRIKPEDSDTLKDVERFESCDVSPISITEKKDIKLPSKQNESKDHTPPERKNLKCPMYKREINGKWIVEEKVGSDKQCHVNGENIFKINTTGTNSATTYASSKSHISYKKYSNSPHQEVSKQSFHKLDKKVLKSSPSRGKNIKRDEKTELKLKDALIPKPQDSIISPKKSSIDSDEKSDGIGSDTKSPISDIENRDFLIDDEISDQPELVCSFLNGKMTESSIPSLQQSVTELHVLQMSSVSNKTKDGLIKSHRERLCSENRDSMVLSSELGSSCSSIESDDLMMDLEKKLDFPDGTINEGMASPMRKLSDIQAVEEQLSTLVLNKSAKVDFDDKARKRVFRRSSGSHGAIGSSGKDEWRLRSVGLPLRPPRPMSFSETDDGSIVIDSSSYRLLSQDLNGVKTLLFRLKSVIQEAETINPFDQNIFYQSLVHSDFPLNSVVGDTNSGTSPSNKPANLSVENADLRRQLVLLHQQLEEKDRTIHLLQQQMTKYSNFSRYNPEVNESVNAATQTERPRMLASSLTPSLNNSSETLVSFRISKQRGHF